MGIGNPITIVQGGQYGSEAKGAIAGYLCVRDRVDLAVRTGATNAGHTVYYDGRPFRMQQLPVGWVNPRTTLVIGAGALIDPAILDHECTTVSGAVGSDVRNRLVIDHRCGVHSPVHAGRSKESGRHYLIGATGKGCSEALIDRIRGRGMGYKQFGSHPDCDKYNVGDTEQMLNRAWDEGAKILLEGTQGQGLDLYLGPYPYTTHKQTGPAQWMLEAGLSPSLPTEIVLVLRSFPIRVAGNSGPMRHEISWPILAGEINAKREAAGLPPIVSEQALQAFQEAVRTTAQVFRSNGVPIPHDSDGSDQHVWRDRDRWAVALSELNTSAWALLSAKHQRDLSNLFEITTVTKKLRRVARFSVTDAFTAIRQTRPSWIAMTFANYLDPIHWYTAHTPPPSIPGMEDECILMWSYGPEHRHIVDLRDAADRST